MRGVDMSYLTKKQRYQIEAMYNSGQSKKAIASFLGCSLQTVYNELRRGVYVGEYKDKPISFYSAVRAQFHFDLCQTSKGKSIKLGHNYAFANFISEQISAGSSPAVALARWEKDNGFFISLPTLYRYIGRGYIPNVTRSSLLEAPDRVKREYKHVIKRYPKGEIIENRPKEVLNRTSFGHWEMDLVVGKAMTRPCFLTLTERKSRFEIVLKLPSRRSTSVVAALNRLERRCDFSHIFKTITCDNGAEFQNWYGMEKSIHGGKRTKVYYCHPYCSCERGSNERHNRMIRRFFPKGITLAPYSQFDASRVAWWLNNYERKVLDWKTPQEVFSDFVQIPDFFKIH
jgi:IS30 family transposase